MSLAVPDTPSPNWPTNVHGLQVQLQPLGLEHVAGLVRSCSKPGSWESVWVHLMDGHLFRDGGVDLVVRTFLERRDDGTDYPFALLLPNASGGAADVIGITRFLEIDWPNRCIEIGTLIGQDFQGKGYNLDSKLAMLTIAFDHLDVERVQFKVDTRNARSMAGVEGLNAQREGVLRRHILMADGHFRSSVVYSILRSEWPASRAHIRTALQVHGLA